MSFSMLKSETSSQNYQNGLTSNSILPKLYLLKHFVGKVFIQHTLFVLTYLLVNLVSCPRVMQQYLSQRLDSALHYRVGKILAVRCVSVLFVTWRAFTTRQQERECEHA